MTNKRVLTQMVIHSNEEVVTNLGKGQLFGEGRFIELYNRQMKEQLKQIQNARAQNKTVPILKLPDEI